jgi:hypothetical protein
MRYELSDFEWTAIKPMLPNKTRGVRRVNTVACSMASFGCCGRERPGVTFLSACRDPISQARSEPSGFRQNRTIRIWLRANESTP